MDSNTCIGSIKDLEIDIDCLDIISMMYGVVFRAFGNFSRRIMAGGSKGFDFRGIFSRRNRSTSQFG